MCSINHEMKAIYLHIPKNGGLYIQNILEKYYGFKTLYFTRSDHYLFDDYEKEEYNKENYKLISNGFINIKKFGVLNYFKTSKEHDEKMNMDDEKWKSYYKFTFVRDPYTKFISAYKYLVKNSFIDLKNFIDKKDSLNNYIYTHAFITQYEHMIDENNMINFNKIGRFENLNEDLINILFEIGFEKIKHGNALKKNIKVNSSNSSSYNDFYNQEILNSVNIIFNIDFETYNYTKFEKLEDFNNYYDNLENNFETNNKELYEKLLSLDKIDDSNNIEINLGDEKINVENDDININNLYDEKFILGNKNNKDKYLKLIIHKLFKGLKPVDKETKKNKDLKEKKINDEKKLTEEEIHKTRILYDKINNVANDYFKIENLDMTFNNNNNRNNDDNKNDNNNNNNNNNNNDDGTDDDNNDNNNNNININNKKNSQSNGDNLLQKLLNNNDIGINLNKTDNTKLTREQFNFFVDKLKKSKLSKNNNT
jgi:hypothetical protein